MNKNKYTHYNSDEERPENMKVLSFKDFLTVKLIAFFFTEVKVQILYDYNTVISVVQLLQKVPEYMYLRTSLIIILLRMQHNSLSLH